MTPTTRQVEALRELADDLECDDMHPALIGNQLHNLANEIENAAADQRSARNSRPNLHVIRPTSAVGAAT